MAIGCSNTTSTETPPKKADGFYKQLNMQHQFKVHGCAVNYNGTDLYMSSGVAPWLKALGKNYRKIETVAIPHKVYMYIYDDLGVRLVEQVKSKKIHSFRFRLKQPAHVLEAVSAVDGKVIGSDYAHESPKSDFRNAIDVDGVLVGAYPMHDEIRSAFRAETSVSYKSSADCTSDQEPHGGGGFFIEVGTSFAEPEVIDSLYFYNSFDTMDDEQKAAWSEERNKKDCMDPKTRNDWLIKEECDEWLEKQKGKAVK
jgi:hypothetical protein